MNTGYVYSGGSAQVGELKATVLWGKGPSSYSQTNGDALTNPGSGDYIAFASPTVSASGNYDVEFVPSVVPNIRAGAKSPGVSGYVARYFYSGAAANGKVVSSVAVTGGSGYTAGTYTLTSSGGGGTRQATFSVTVNASGAIASASVIDPGIGFTSTPTVAITALGAGSAGAVTPTVSAATAGAEVAASTNLSAELFQFSAAVTQL